MISTKKLKVNEMNDDECSTQEFRKRLAHFLFAYGFNLEDSTIRSQEEWLELGNSEVSADDFLLHLSTDDQSLIDFADSAKHGDDLGEFADHCGWFCERGYHWSWHFMPLSQFHKEQDRMINKHNQSLNRK